MNRGSDQFSFPSGHASRAAMLVGIFLYVNPVPILLYPPILAWATSVCLSRVISEKHYLLDVISGIGIGLVECLLLSMLWLSHDSAVYLVNYLSDEKLDGGEYHI
jgi:presqualene diphosphate phosphatase